MMVVWGYGDEQSRAKEQWIDDAEGLRLVQDLSTQPSHAEGQRGRKDNAMFSAHVVMTDL